MTDILGQLKWEYLKERRKDNRLVLLYKGLKSKARIPADDLIPKTRHGRNQHSLAFQIPSASKDVYKYIGVTIATKKDYCDSIDIAESTIAILLLLRVTIAILLQYMYYCRK